jgi:hypothetical protein
MLGHPYKEYSVVNVQRSPTSTREQEKSPCSLNKGTQRSRLSPKTPFSAESSIFEAGVLTFTVGGTVPEFHRSCRSFEPSLTLGHL